MDSQESDICTNEAMELLMADDQVNDLMQTVGDWSAVPLPDTIPPNPTGELPSRNEWPGEHLFDAFVDMSGHKKQYVVSTKLNKVFVDLGRVVPFQIKWDGTPGLFVRALMVFTEADHLRTPIRRCATHRDKDNPTNSKYDYAEHVLACENENALYRVDEHSQRHSVIVPLFLQQGADHALLNYKFMCKTSCTGGLNRSQTDVIFTLEDNTGAILGRQKIGVKICSCPKRDKEKEEQNLTEQNGKRKMKIKKEEKTRADSPTQPAKRIKMEYDAASPSCSFMVTAPTPEVAQMARDILNKWSEVKALEWAAPGTIPMPLLTITDDVAVISQPYL